MLGLTTRKIDSQYLRALAFQLYEKNGLIKRSDANEIVKLITSEDRKKLWGMGIKMGRYHIYLPKMLKPKALNFRVGLWKLFNNSTEHDIPKSGLNFIINRKYDKNFMLLCGFEKFKEFYVRVDILEKLFIKMLESTKERKFKINSDMINLLGCSTENFHKLMALMNYKKAKEPDTYFYLGDKKKEKKIFKNKDSSNPFNKLLELNLK